MQLDKLPKAAGVVVVDRLGISKRLHDGTVEPGRSRSFTSITPLQSEPPTHKTELPALQQRLLHMGRPVSGGNLQRVLAHAGQELQDQFGAFCFPSTALSTEGG